MQQLKLNWQMAGLYAAALVAFAAVESTAVGQDDDERVVEPRMTIERLAELILRVDEDAQQDANRWFLTVDDTEAVMIYDLAADRMRIMVPIIQADTLDEAMMQRLLQANFDTALDARYAIAQDILWGTFIHSLSDLSDEQFLVGLGQTINVANSFGTSFSSGLLMFGGGDAAEIQRQELIEELKKKKEI